MARYDDLDTKLIGLVAGVSAVLTFVIIGAVQAYYYTYAKNEFVRKEVEVPIESAKRSLDEQAATLEQFAWVDQEKGIVAIPIEDAMKDVIEEYGPAEAEHSNSLETNKPEESDGKEVTE